MKVAIVGLGLIGGSVALDLKKRGFASEVIGVDASPENAATAKKLGIADRIATLEEAVPAADLSVVAVPVNAASSLIPKVLDLLADGASATDVGSTKSEVVAAIRAHRRRKQFVASHPMAGTENSGPTAALSGLFDGKAAVICDEADSGKEHVARVEAMYLALGMRLIRMNAAEHDMHAAYISHLSHITSFMLANTVLDIEKNVSSIFDLAGGGFESTVRLAKSSPEMWIPIFQQNQIHLKYALKAYIDHLSAFHAALAAGRWDELSAQLHRANEIRRVLEDIGARAKAPVKKW